MSYNFSEDYFESNEFKNTLKRFEDADKNGEEIILDSEEFVDIAEYYYNLGKVETAVEIIDRTIDLYPGAAAPLLFKARMALLDYNDIDKANYYADLIEDKTDLEYFYLKAEIMIVDGKADEADEYLEERFNEIDDDEIDFFAIDTAALFIDYNKVDKAEKWINRSEATDAVEYKEQYARIMMEIGEYEKSQTLFNELIDKNPYSTKYWNSLASSQFLCNNLEDAIQSCEFALAINPENATALLNKANGLYNLGNYKEALKYYTRYCSQCPNDENGETLIGFCNMLLEDYVNAIKHFQIAENLSSPDSPMLSDIYKDWAFALCRLNRIDESMAILDKAEALATDKNDLLVYRGSLLLGSGRFFESKKYFLTAIRDSKFSPTIVMKIAILIYESGNVEIAYKMFQMLYKRHPECNSGYPFYAACCYSLKKEDEFLECLKKAIEHSPEETKIALGKIFPDNVDISNYYQYMLKKLGKA